MKNQKKKSEKQKGITKADLLLVVKGYSPKKNKEIHG